jgi:vancomycin permeability regulator SanA
MVLKSIILRFFSSFLVTNDQGQRTNMLKNIRQSLKQFSMDKHLGIFDNFGHKLSKRCSRQSVPNVKFALLVGQSKYFPDSNTLAYYAKAANITTQKVLYRSPQDTVIRVTRLGEFFVPIGLLLEAHCDFL